MLTTTLWFYLFSRELISAIARKIAKFKSKEKIIAKKNDAQFNNQLESFFD